MIAQFPAIRILPPIELGDDPIQALRPGFGPKPQPSWYLAGGHNGSRLTVHKLRHYTDPTCPPTPEQIAEALPGWMRCDCRRCRDMKLVLAWCAWQALDLAHGRIATP